MATAATDAARPQCLILGLGVHGLAVARSLGRRGLHVEAVDVESQQPQRFSRYLRRLHLVDSLDDQRLVEFLRNYVKRATTRTVLFITTDRAVPVISAARAELSASFDFNLPPDPVVNALMQKDQLPQFLDRVGTPRPATMAVESSADLSLLPERIGFPCILKPTVRAEGFKAEVAGSAEELAALYARASLHCDRFVAQQWIPGDDSDVYFGYAYIGRDGEPKAIFVGHKLRQFPRGTGIAASAAGCDDPFVRDETLRMFRAAGYRGFGSTEFRRNPANGKYYFIEFTVGRTDYNVGCAISNGVDLPYIGYCDNAGLPPPSPLPVQRNAHDWIDLSRCISAIRQDRQEGRISLLGAWSAVAGCLAPGNDFTLFDAGDPGPFAAHCLHRLLAVPARALRKARRLLFTTA